MSYFRTAILLAALTALFMGIGFLIGGQSGMIIALLIAGAMNLFTYWNADKMVLSMYGAHEVDAAARKVITDAGHGEHFAHGLGHGVGLQIHERPWVRPGIEDVLEPGMALTIEPGIYLEGLGGVRIEDLVVVGDEGPDVLTSFPRDLARVG